MAGRTPARTATRTAAAKPKAEEKPQEVKQQDEYGEREEGSLSGNLTFDPELRFTGSGRAVCTLNVACNERVKNEDTGEWEDTEPEFYRVTVWGQQGEHVAEALLRGDRIVAIGFFQDRTYVNRDGESVTTTEFTARDIGASMLFRETRVVRTSRASGNKR